METENVAELVEEYEKENGLATPEPTISELKRHCEALDQAIECLTKRVEEEIIKRSEMVESLGREMKSLVREFGLKVGVLAVTDVFGPQPNKIAVLRVGDRKDNK